MTLDELRKYAEDVGGTLLAAQVQLADDVEVLETMLKDRPVRDMLAAARTMSPGKAELAVASSLKASGEPPVRLLKVARMMLRWAERQAGAGTCGTRTLTRYRS